MSYPVSDDILDTNFLYPPPEHQQSDILDEFLDQRVYEVNSPQRSMLYDVDEDDSDNSHRHVNGTDTHSHISSQVPSPTSKYGGGDVGVGGVGGGGGDFDNDYVYANNNPRQDNSNGSMSIDEMNDMQGFPTFKEEFNDMSNMSNQDLFSGGSNHLSISNNHSNSNFPINNSVPNSISQYDVLRDEFSKIKFGNYNMKICPDSITLPESENLLDFSPQAMDSLPYKLSLSSLPDYSRVETQIKINFNLNPPPPENFLHIPQDLIAKNKFCLPSDYTLDPLIQKNLLYLECYVLTSDLSKSCHICSRCIKREQKRASRRRIGDDNDLPQISPNGIVKNNPNTWADEQMIKRAIIFNCKQVISFPPPNGLNNDLNKSAQLSARIICYCRHHKEAEGFKLLFVIKNRDNEVVAKQISSKIMIMDRKKSPTTGANSAPTFAPGPTTNNSGVTGLEASLNGSGVNTNGTNTTGNSPARDDRPDFIPPFSPNSIDESSDLTTDDRNLKRKKLSVDDSNNMATNPMFNGSNNLNGFSPLSNSDTNTNASLTKHNPFQSSRVPSSISSNITLPTIQRIIPAQGPIRGGIEVTLLGFNFNPSLSVKFGSNLALATHCWSETTIVTYLPPANIPGQVLVSFENHDDLLTQQQQQIFTYTDDTDKQLIELALQIVGLKMNGKLEDAKNIAKRIVGNDNLRLQLQLQQSLVLPQDDSGNNVTSAENVDEWYNNAQNTVNKLATLNVSVEEVLVNFLKLVDLPNCPILIPNWSLTNSEGQSLLHLASIKNYFNLVKFLINHGSKVDAKDNSGITPLFYASISGNRGLMNLLLEFKANKNLKLSNNKTIRDYCDLNVLDLFDNDSLTKSTSIDSLNSIFDIPNGYHISKMNINEDSTEFADVELSVSEEDLSNDYSESDIHDEELSEDISDYEDEDADIEETSSDGESNSESETHSIQTVIPASRSDSSDGTIYGDNNSEDRKNLWQTFKDVFNNDEDLPNYDELFPFGPSRQVDKTVEVDSDSSEDLIISYINHPRKTVENDKMLIFFWVPILLTIVSIVIFSFIGYRFETIDSMKNVIREGLGNIMVGQERIKKVFN